MSDYDLQLALVEEAAGLTVMSYWHANDEEVCFPLGQDAQQLRPVLWVGHGAIFQEPDGEIHWGLSDRRDAIHYNGWWIVQKLGVGVYRADLSFKDALTLLRHPLVRKDLGLP